MLPFNACPLPNSDISPHSVSMPPNGDGSENPKHRNSFTANIQNPWSVLTTIAAIFFFLYFSVQWVGGTSLTYESNNLKGGDLAQHYVAGLLWNEHRAIDLYRNFEFSQRFIQWKDSLPTKPKFGMLRNNYVYAPTIARMASAFSHWSFADWLWVWLLIMIFTTILSWYLLSKIVTGIRTRRLEDWLVPFSFPCLWYTFNPFQNSTITLFILSAASLLTARGYCFIAGALLGCAFYKPQFILFIGLIMFAAGRFRFAIGLVSSSSALLAIQLFACGLDLHIEWIQSMSMSMTGKQFGWVGLNQSWRGWFLSLPGLPQQFAGWTTLIISVSLCIAAGLWLRKLENSKFLNPGFQLLIAAAIWTIASPYTAYYDFLLTLGLWAIVCRALPYTRGNTLICFMGWMASLICSSGALGFPWITAPFLTLWILLAIKSISLSYINHTFVPEPL